PKSAISERDLKRDTCHVVRLHHSSTSDVVNVVADPVAVDDFDDVHPCNAASHELHGCYVAWALLLPNECMLSRVDVEGNRSLPGVRGPHESVFEVTHSQTATGTRHLYLKRLRTTKSERSVISGLRDASVTCHGRFVAKQLEYGF